MQASIGDTASPIGTKRGRESTGSGGGSRPGKKSKTGETNTKEKSAFLLLITKGGRKYEHLSSDEVLGLRDKMIAAIFADDDDPLIDWFRRVNGRALCACTTSEAVKWVKKFVRKCNPAYGAWLPREGPNSCTLEVTIPPPAAKKFTPERVLEKMQRTKLPSGELAYPFHKGHHGRSKNNQVLR